MGRRGELLAAVDFGSRQVRVLIARVSDDGVMRILGHGVADSRGCVSQGVIQNLGAAQSALKKAMKLAEKEAGAKVTAVFCGLNGRNVETFIREGQVKLEREIVELEHLQEALDLASRDILAAGKRPISSVTSEEWYVDDLRVTEPVGIRGSILKTRVHFALLPTVIENNILQCIDANGLELEDVVYLPLAAAIGCLTPEDIELGVGVLDLGRTTVGLSIYRDRRIINTNSFEFGGIHITRDVAAGLQISYEEAIELIMEYGIAESLIENLEDDGEEAGDGEEIHDSAEGLITSSATNYDNEGNRQTTIKLKSAVRGAPQIVKRAELDMIIFERSRELLNVIQRYFTGRNLTRHLVRGVVLTGGAGTIKNMDRLAEAILQVPVRLGHPMDIEAMPPSVNDPTFTPAVGILKHAYDFRMAIRSGRIEIQRGFIGSIFHGIAKFIGKYFF